jgi:hypothetical protein
MSAVIVTEAVFEDSGCYLLARIRGNDAANIVQADISSINLCVSQKGGTPDTAGTAVTVATVIFNTLQTDARWTVDSTGYNFRYEVPAASLPVGGRKYLFEFKFTPASGPVFHVVFEVPTLNLLRS